MSYFMMLCHRFNDFELILLFSDPEMMEKQKFAFPDTENESRAISENKTEAEITKTKILEQGKMFKPFCDIQQREMGMAKGSSKAIIN